MAESSFAQGITLHERGESPRESDASAPGIRPPVRDAASGGERLPFDPFPFEQDRLTTPEVDVGRGEIVQALVSAGVVVVLDKGAHLRLELAGQVIVLQQDAVLERLMPALDLALGLWVAWGTPDVRHAPALKPRGQIT